MVDLSPNARHVSAVDGHKVRHPSGAFMNIKVFAHETNGAYSLMETVLPPGGVVPKHVHEHEDENNYILDGQLTMHIGDEVFTAKAGSFVVAPKGVTQFFRNDGYEDCRFLTTFTPGGAEEYFREAGELIKSTPNGRPSREKLLALQEKYALRYL
ncbi:cupin domain-containing protein [Ectopseudomonas mendocina]|uniref:Cupin domain-containing protein n=1 Tax=Ectopseudomonas mendocina TaxID=300 RepID=A0ABZ2RLL6_ECTME